MSTPAPNLFNALFDFRSRDKHTPEENFLSEAFAYVLKTSQPACDAWLSKVLKRPVNGSKCKIFTRKVERFKVEIANPESKREQFEVKIVYPDMLIEAELSDGTSEVIYSEHKWGAQCSPNQLQSYYEVAKQRTPCARVVFIGSHLRQRLIALRTRLEPEKKRLDGCFLWDEVYQVLEDKSLEKSEIFQQFLVFMKTNELNPGEMLSPAGLVALPEASKATRSINRAIRILGQMSWDIIPSRYMGNPKIRYEDCGCTDISFSTEGWCPGVNFGFLIDTSRGYEVSLTQPVKGIDLMLRIGSHKEKLRSERMGPVLAILEQKLPFLKKNADGALLLGQAGNGCPYSLVIVQKCLAEIIKNAETEADQHDAIYQFLQDHLTILFGDGTLEAALKASGLDGVAISNG